MAECYVDSDCPGVELCYQNTTASWLPDGISRCLCNTEYGWVHGPTCNGFSTTTYFLAATMGLHSTICGIVAILAVYVLITLKLRKKLKANGLSITLVLVLVESLSIAARGITEFIILYTPEKQTENATIVGEETTKGHQLIGLVRVLVSINVVFGFLAGLHVSLVWLQIARRSKNFFAKTQNALRTYRKMLVAVESVVILSLIILSSVGKYSLIGVAVLPFMIGTMIVYTVGLLRLRSLLGSNSSSKAYRAMLFNIHMCYLGVLASAIVIVCGSIGLGILSLQGYKEITPQGKISVFVVLHALVSWGLTLLMVSIQLYALRFVRKDKPKSSLKLMSKSFRRLESESGRLSVSVLSGTRVNEHANTSNKSIRQNSYSADSASRDTKSMSMKLLQYHIYFHRS